MLIKCCSYIVIFCFYFILPTTTYSREYYVDNLRGNNINEGSKKLPWKTIEKVNRTHFKPGDSLFFKRGQSWHNTLMIPSSGKKGHPITFSAYGKGAAPVIDGSFSAAKEWLQLKKNIYAQPCKQRPYILYYNNQPQAPIFTIVFNPKIDKVPKPGAQLLQIKKGTPYTNFWVLFSDQKTKTVYGITNKYKHWDTARQIQIRQINTISGKEETWPMIAPPINLTPSLYSLSKNGHWYWHNGSIYLFSDIHPDQINISIGKLKHAINTNNQDYLNIRNIKVRGSNETGILVKGTRNSLIEDVTVDGAGNKEYRAGIMLVDSSFNIIHHNTIKNVLGNGIVMYGLSDVTHYNTISDNKIEQSGGSGILIGGENPFRVAHNYITGNIILTSNQLTYDGAGIYLYFCGVGNVLKGNTIRDGGARTLRNSGIMADTDAGPVTIIENHIENNSFAGIALTESKHVVLRNRLIHNTSPQWNSAEIIFFRVNDPARNYVIKDNYIETNTSFFRIEKGSTKGHLIDFNKYNGGTEKPFSWENSPLNYKQWQKKTNYDQNSSYQK